jgi:ribosome-associated translation inhibitor RaiA
MTTQPLKMTIKIGQEEIKEAIKQYMKAKLERSVKTIQRLDVKFIIHNSYSDQRDFPDSVEAEIQIPLE